MDRLVALQPFGNQAGYLAHVIKECDDWDDEAHDDSTYRADFSDTPRGEPEPSPFLLRDLVELNVALREASRAYTDPSIFSAIEKIESAVAQYVHVDSVTDEPCLAEVRAAVDAHEQLKIDYASGLDGRGARALHRAARDPGPQRPRAGARLLHDAQGLAHVPRRPHRARPGEVPGRRGAPAGPGRQLAHPGRRGGRRGRRGRRALSPLALRAPAQRALGGAGRRAPRRAVPPVRRRSSSTT